MRIQQAAVAPIAVILMVVGGAAPGAAQSHRFTAFGDSITVGHGDGIECTEPPVTAGYPPRVRSRLATMGLVATALNVGVCGEITAEGLSRIDNVLSQYILGSTSNEVVVLMEGTNDISQFVGFETSAFNVAEMAIRVVAAGALPLISSVIPRGPGPETDEHNGKARTYGKALESKAEILGVPFADPFSVIFAIPDFFETYYFDQLHPNPAGYSLLADILAPAVFDAFELEPPLICDKLHEPCAPGPTTLCLNQGRFRVEANWATILGEEGLATSVPQTDDTGAFWFFSPDNIELLVKILDGRNFNDYFWVFYGGLSDVEYTITVIDTVADVCKEYHNAQGVQSSVGDTAAFFEPPS